MKSMQVDFCGVRGSLPAAGGEFARYGGHPACVALSHDDERAPSLILDAGTGLQRAAALLDGAPFSGSIILSHLHWDHVQGLPFFPAGDRADSHVEVLLPQQGNGASAVDVLAGL